MRKTFKNRISDQVLARKLKEHKLMMERLRECEEIMVRNGRPYWTGSGEWLVENRKESP